MRRFCGASKGLKSSDTMAQDGPQMSTSNSWPLCMQYFLGMQSIFQFLDEVSHMLLRGQISKTGVERLNQ